MNVPAEAACVLVADSRAPDEAAAAVFRDDVHRGADAERR